MKFRFKLLFIVTTFWINFLLIFPNQTIADICVHQNPSLRQVSTRASANLLVAVKNNDDSANCTGSLFDFSATEYKDGVEYPVSVSSISLVPGEERQLEIPIVGPTASLVTLYLGAVSESDLGTYTDKFFDYVLLDIGVTSPVNVQDKQWATGNDYNIELTSSNFPGNGFLNFELEGTNGNTSSQRFLLLDQNGNTNLQKLTIGPTDVNARTIIPGDYKLHIYCVLDSGQYCVDVAKPDGGFDNGEAVIDGINIIQIIPAQPIVSGTTNITNTTATLNWTALAGTGLTYKIYNDTTLLTTVTTPSVPSGTITASSVSISGLNPGTSYTAFKVTASNTGGEGAPASFASFTTLPNVPALPTSLNAVAGNRQVTLTWTAPVSDSTHSAPTSYKVYRTTTAGFVLIGLTPISPTTLNTTSFTDTNVVNDTPYFYKVVASNGGGDSGVSNEVSVTPLPLVPAGPTSLTQSADDTTASLGWTAPTSDNTHGEPSTSGYKIYNGNAASPLSNITLPAITITGTSALVTGLINGTPYIFRVTASNTGGEGSAATFAAVTLHPLAPATPVLSAPISGDGLVSLSWAQSSGATGYSVYRDGIALKASPITALTYIDSSAINGTTYRYTVKAFNLGVTSEFSNEVSATPLPPVPSAPTNLQATAGIPGSDSISLSWVASQRATSYKVYRGDVAGFIIGIPFATPSTNSYTDSVATSRSGAYYYKVAATNMGGDSVLLSNEVSAVSSPVSHPTVITSNPSNTSGILAGVSTSFQWRIADLDLEPLSYSINWGDGSARQNSTITVDSITGTYNPLNLTHKWSSAGGYNIVLTIGGAHGDSATSNVSVQVSGIVNPPPPPATISKIVNLINQKMTAAINNLLSK